MFGSNHEEIGSSSANLILKTAGKIRILWGKKFIDLLDENGNINGQASSILKKVDSVDKITSNGIYVVNGDVIISIDGEKITLSTETGNSYVSFIEEQEISKEQLHRALKNIGLVYENLQDVPNISKGIVYIEGELSLYIFNNGTAVKYNLEIPNPYPKQFVITKENENELGSLIITGTGETNGLFFDGLKIYSENLYNIFKSDRKFLFLIGNSKVLRLEEGKIITNKVLSENANENYGYRLYMLSGESTLEVDNLTVRNGISSNQKEDLILTNYLKKLNIIKGIIKNPTTSSIINTYYLYLKYNNEYNINDILIFFIEINKDLISIKVKVLDINLNLNFCEIEQIETSYNLENLQIENYIIGLINEDLIIGNITGYNNKTCGIISKQNILYSTKFDKEGEGILIYPYYSQELYNELSNNIENSNYTYVIPPLGLIKKLLLVHSAEYKRLDKKIYFRDYSGNDLFNIDATDFIKDGMVSNVVIEPRIIEGLEIDCLVITFNEDSGLEEIPIPLSKIFDSSLYYTKIEINEIIEDIYDAIPSALVQSDWNETNTNNPSYIKNKPTIPAEQVLSDWNETNVNSKAYIKNKPDIYTKSEIDEKISEGDSMPLGAIIMWAYSSIPDGWHICDGSTLSGEEYLSFINLYGNTLPDLRGKFVGGRDNTIDFNNLGKTGGEKKHTLTVDEIPSHYHEIKDYYHNEIVDNIISYNVPNYDRISTNGKFGTGSSDNDNDAMLYYEHNTKNTGGNNSHENLPPYYTLYYIIKVKGSNDTPVVSCDKYEFAEMGYHFDPSGNVGSAVARSSTSFDVLSLDEESDSWINLEAVLNDGSFYIYIIRPNDTTLSYREGTAIFKSNDGCIFRVSIIQGNN